MDSAFSIPKALQSKLTGRAEPFAGEEEDENIQVTSALHFHSEGKNASASPAFETRQRLQIERESSNDYTLQ